MDRTNQCITMLAEVMGFEAARAAVLCAQNPSAQAEEQVGTIGMEALNEWLIPIAIPSKVMLCEKDNDGVVSFIRHACAGCPTTHAAADRLQDLCGDITKGSFQMNGLVRWWDFWIADDRGFSVNVTDKGYVCAIHLYKAPHL